MKKDEVRQAIIAEWLGLPASERSTEQQAVVFAQKATQRHEWRAAGDPYQEVMGWLSRYIGMS